MTRVATVENEDFLLMIARHGTASHMEKVVAKYQRVQSVMVDKVEQEREQEHEEARKLVYYQDDDGMWVVHARLPAEAGSLLVKAIEAVAAPVQQEKQRQILEREEATECVKDVSAETFPEAVERENPNPYQDDLLEHSHLDDKHWIPATTARRLTTHTLMSQNKPGPELCSQHPRASTSKQRSSRSFPSRRCTPRKPPCRKWHRGWMQLPVHPNGTGTTVIME